VMGKKKKKRSKCTWVVGKKGKEKRKRKRGGICYGNIEGEWNRIRKVGILEVVKKINKIK
jgi:hypothetical protein